MDSINVDGYILLSSEEKNTLKSWCQEDKEIKLGTVQDEELGEQVICFTGKHGYCESLVYPNTVRKSTEPRKDLRFRHLHFLYKMEGKIFSMEILVEGMDEKRYVLRFGTNYPNVAANADVCYIPMNLHNHWVHMNIDLKELVAAAFSSEYVRVYMIRLGSNIKLREIFMTQSSKVSLYLTSSHYSRFNHKRTKPSTTKGRKHSHTKQSADKNSLNKARESSSSIKKKSDIITKKENQPKQKIKRKRKLDNCILKNKDSDVSKSFPVSENFLERKYSTLSDTIVYSDGLKIESVDVEREETRTIEKKRLMSNETTMETEVAQLVEAIEEDTEKAGRSEKESIKETLTKQSFLSLPMPSNVVPSVNVIERQTKSKNNTILINKKPNLAKDIKNTQLKVLASSTPTKKVTSSTPKKRATSSTPSKTFKKPPLVKTSDSMKKTSAVGIIKVGPSLRNSDVSTPKILSGAKKQSTHEGGTSKINQRREPLGSSKSPRKIQGITFVPTEKSSKALMKYDYI